MNTDNKTIQKPDGYYNLILINLEKLKYYNAFQILNELESKSNKDLINDINLIIYLLSYITGLPDTYKEKIKNMSFEDLIVENDKSNISNNIRSLIYKRKFKESLSLIKLLNNKSYFHSLLKFLLSEANIKNKNNIQTLCSLIKSKKYEQVIHFLDEKEKNQKLFKVEKTIKNLSQIIININETKIVPTSHNVNVSDIYELIENNNFSEALILTNTSNIQKDIYNENNPLYLILLNLTELIKEINLQKNETLISLNNALSKETKTHKYIFNKQKKLKKAINLIKESFNNKDFETMITYLREYLFNINKTEYETLIIETIKLCIINNYSCDNIYLLLTNISKEDYNLDIDNYINLFYISIYEKNFDESQIYLNIIEKYNTKNISIKTLIKDLEKSKKETVKQKETKEEKVVVNTDTYKTDYELVNEYYNELLKNKDIVLSEEMEIDKAKIIENIIKDLPNVCTFIIGKKKKRQLVLKYKSSGTLKHIDMTKLINEAHNYFNNKEYEKSINIWTEILKYYDEPKPFVYSALAWAHFNIGNLKKALDYFLIASHQYKYYDRTKDFTKVINSIKSELNNEKPKKHLNTKPFIKYENDEEEYIKKDFKKIDDYIRSTNLDVQTACLNLGMNYVHVDIVILLYAKKFYEEGNIECGDEYLKSYEESTSKTDKTKEMYEEIKENKLLYRYKVNTKKLSFKI